MVIRCLKFTYLGCHTAVRLYEAKTHDISDLQKCFMQTCFVFEQDIINTAVAHGAEVSLFCLKFYFLETRSNLKIFYFLHSEP